MKKSSNAQARQGRRPLYGTLLAAAAVGPLFGVSQGPEGPDVDATRAALEKWVETRRVISQEKRDWALGRELLEERAEIVQREVDTLRERIAEAEKSIAEADEKRAGLLTENERLKEASVALSDAVVALETRTRELLQRLPDPIRERVKPLSQRFPTNPEETDLSIGERFQNIVGVLNDVNKFHREITVISEVRTLESGASAEVTALYVGIGQGYYVSGDGTAAGVGTGTAEGWVWVPANESVGEIGRAIAILENEEIAGFVQVPVRTEEEAK